MTMTREQQILSLAGIVHAIARRYPGDQDDLTQAAWEGAIHAVDKWDGRGTLAGYAWLVVQAATCRHIKRTTPKAGRGGQRAYYTLQPGEKPTFVQFDGHDRASDDRSIENAPARIDLYRILARLEPRDRAIVVLLGEYSQHEVARIVGCAQSTIGCVVNRARAAAA